MRVRRFASARWCDGLLCRGIFTFSAFTLVTVLAPLWGSDLMLLSDGPAVSGDWESLRDRVRAVKHSGDRLGPPLEAVELAVSDATAPEDPAVNGTSMRSSRNEKSVYRSGAGGRPWMAVPRSNWESVEKPLTENWPCRNSSKLCCS